MEADVSHQNLLLNKSLQIYIRWINKYPITCLKFDVRPHLDNTGDMQHSVSTNSEIKQSETNFSETKFNDWKKLIRN